jgi:hypothetical protein
MGTLKGVLLELRINFSGSRVEQDDRIERGSDEFSVKQKYNPL